MRYIDNGGVSLALETRGSGRRRLLFAHGWISSRRIFYDVVARLDPERYTSYLLDFRGAGLSDRPGEGHDLVGYAGDLRAALEAVDGPVDLIAHSMGGKVAQYVALEPPPNLARLILIAPGTARAYVTSVRHRALAEAAFGSRLRIERFQRAAMVRDIAPDAMERLIDDALVAQREAWFGWYDRGRAVDFSERLHELKLPTVVIAGNRDPLAPLARLRRDVGAAIAGAVFITLRDVGHNAPVEVPAEVAGIIERLHATQPHAGAQRSSAVRSG